MCIYMLNEYRKRGTRNYSAPEPLNVLDDPGSTGVLNGINNC